MADVTKIKLPDNSEYNLKDHRIPGVDTTPTSGSDNVVTSGGIYDAMTQNEYVVAAAINDLNDRLLDVEDSVENTTIPTKISDLENDSGFTSNIGTLTGVSFNGSPATVSNGVASITASAGDVNVIESVKVNSTALTPDANKAVDVTVPIEVINLGVDPVSAPSGTYTRCKTAISAGRTVALRVVDSEDNEVYYYYLHSTGVQYAGNWQGLYFSRVAGNSIFYYSLSTNDNLTHSSKSIGTLTGVKFNNTNATINGTVAEITATIPTEVTDSTVATWGYIKSYTETDPTVPAWAKASSKPTYTANEVGAQETLISGTNIKTINNESLLGSGNITVTSGNGIESITTSQNGDIVVALENGNTITIDLTHTHANYLKYQYCTSEANYMAIQNKDSNTLYLISEI